MMNEFVSWANSVASLGEDKKALSLKITASPVSDNPSARLDVETSDAIARITCWDSGDYYAEIISISSEKYLYQLNGNLTADKSISDEFQDFFEHLKC
jgi:hypothetical protein